MPPIVEDVRLQCPYCDHAFYNYPVLLERHVIDTHPERYTAFLKERDGTQLAQR